MARKLITICLALGLALGSATEATAASRSADQAEAIAHASTGLLGRGAGYATPGGSSGVRAVQRRLRELGFRPGPVDGLFGPRTEHAVLVFQRTHGLAVDGIVGPQTRTHLRYHGTEPFAGLGAGYSRPGGSDLTREIQRRLRALGFQPGPVDGLFGPRTERAVRDFQESRGLDPDGLVQGETLTELRGHVALETAADAAPDRPSADEASVSDAKDAPQVQRSPAPAPSEGLMDDPIVLTLLMVLVGGLVAMVALLGPGIAGALAARLAAAAWLLRSEGLRSERFALAGGRREARGPATVRVDVTTGSKHRDAERGTHRAPPARPVLTDREVAVLQLAAEGFTNAQIGARMYLSRHTVKEHLSHAMRKLGATNRLRAISEASSLGLLGENGLGSRSRGDPAAKFAYDDLWNGSRSPDLGVPLGTKEER
jgi:peptidoglycan hydrolase-like protein with peptidoglycan-binding domain/DNA-binding CsgD family transcriptional regulator